MGWWFVAWAWGAGLEEACEQAAEVDMAHLDEVVVNRVGLPHCVGAFALSDTHLMVNPLRRFVPDDVRYMELLVEAGGVGTGCGHRRQGGFEVTTGGRRLVLRFAGNTGGQAQTDVPPTDSERAAGEAFFADLVVALARPDPAQDALDERANALDLSDGAAVMADMKVWMVDVIAEMRRIAPQRTAEIDAYEALENDPSRVPVDRHEAVVGAVSDLRRAAMAAPSVLALQDARRLQRLDVLAERDAAAAQRLRERFVTWQACVAK